MLCDQLPLVFSLFRGALWSVAYYLTVFQVGTLGEYATIDLSLSHTLYLPLSPSLTLSGGGPG